MLQQVTQKKSVRLKSSDKSAETKCQRAQEEAKAAKAKAKTNEEKVTGCESRGFESHREMFYYFLYRILR